MTARYCMIALALGLVLGGCGSSQHVTSMRSLDKQLSCEELLLEINESEFFMTRAERDKSFGMTDVIWPVGYVSDVMDANDAIETAMDRRDYLSRIYEVKRCHEKKPYSMAGYNQAAASLEASVLPAAGPVDSE